VESLDPCSWCSSADVHAQAHTWRHKLQCCIPPRETKYAKGGTQNASRVGVQGFLRCPPRRTWIARSFPDRAQRARKHDPDEEPLFRPHPAKRTRCCRREQERPVTAPFARGRRSLLCILTSRRRYKGSRSKRRLGCRVSILPGAFLLTPKDSCPLDGVKENGEEMVGNPVPWNGRWSHHPDWLLPA
jgi:hypothetical protein